MMLIGLHRLNVHLAHGIRRSEDVSVCFHRVAAIRVPCTIRHKFFTQPQPSTQCPKANIDAVGMTGHILISHDATSGIPHFVYAEEGTRSLIRFENFLASYKRLFQELEQFTLIYLSGYDLNFGAGRLSEKLFPRNRCVDLSWTNASPATVLFQYLMVQCRYWALSESNQSVIRYQSDLPWINSGSAKYSFTIQKRAKRRFPTPARCYPSPHPRQGHAACRWCAMHRE